MNRTRRSYDTQIATLETMLRDFIENDRIYKKEAKEWRDKSDARLTSIEDIWKKIDNPIKGTLWLTALVITVAIGTFFHGLLNAIRGH